MFMYVYVYIWSICAKVAEILCFMPYAVGAFRVNISYGRVFGVCSMTIGVFGVFVLRLAEILCFMLYAVGAFRENIFG